MAGKTQEKATSGATPIRPCTCKQDYQDQKYGYGMRVHNPKTSKGRLIGYTCTGCGTKKLI